MQLRLKQKSAHLILKFPPMAYLSNMLFFLHHHKEKNWTKMQPQKAFILYLLWFNWATLYRYISSIIFLLVHGKWWRLGAAPFLFDLYFIVQGIDLMHWFVQPLAIFYLSTATFYWINLKFIWEVRWGKIIC